MVKMKYALYKKSYSEFTATDYDASSKTILVDLPKVEKPRFPKDWEKIGNWYRLPNGTKVYFWNSGYAENFLVERTINVHNVLSKTISAGITARQDAIDKALEFDRENKTA